MTTMMHWSHTVTMPNWNVLQGNKKQEHQTRRLFNVRRCPRVWSTQTITILSKEEEIQRSAKEEKVSVEIVWTANNPVEISTKWVWKRYPRRKRWAPVGLTIILIILTRSNDGPKMQETLKRDDTVKLKHMKDVHLRMLQEMNYWIVGKSPPQLKLPNFRFMLNWVYTEKWKVENIKTCM